MKALVILAAVAAVGGIGGAAAGLFLKDAPAADAACVEDCDEDGADKTATTDTSKTGKNKTGKDDAHHGDGDEQETDYVSLKHQFVVPIIHDERVTSFVVIALSFEIQRGGDDVIWSHEPKLQDALLRVMFDHAYMGGFSGAFTESERMLDFRNALRETAQAVVGDVLIDVLITEMVRQEV